MVITSAPRSPQYEFIHRRRRYTIMMGLRVVCLLGAVVTYHISPFIAVALVIGGAALPWCAVLIANDGPPRKRRAPLPRVTLQNGPPKLPGASAERTVDG